MTIEYLTDIEHVKECSDVYMGTINDIEKEIYIYDYEKDIIQLEKVTIDTGLLKIFDEIFTNAIDNIQRPESNITIIKTEIKDDYISIYNDGKSIPIEVHSETNIYIPELIFTRLRTSTNFRQKDRITGGKNGVGGTLTAIFSKKFVIKVINNKKEYIQELSDNLNKILPPIIKDTNCKDSVTITFYPDFDLLHNIKYKNEIKNEISYITDDMKKVFSKRIHDVSHLNINLEINSIRLPKLSWKEYTELYNLSPKLYLYETSRWKIGFGINSLMKVPYISYVNNVATYDGGEHVKYIQTQILKEIKTNKKCTNINLVSLKNHLIVFVYAIISNPSFESQAKEKLKSTPNTFGSECNIPQELIQKFIKESKIISILTQNNESKTINHKSSTITDLYSKLTKANKAGTKEGYKCTLFLCEGLSAKAMCMKGMRTIGFDYYGCFPLKGKVLNVKAATNKKYEDNEELTALKTIIGLKDGKEYESTKGLNYGKIVCMKDADSDGAAIMGLILNFFMTKFPSLLNINGFFSEFITPMIIIRYNNNLIKYFYNNIEYEKYIQTNEHKNIKSTFKVEFIKGLATNEASDINTYFKEYDQNCIKLEFNDITPQIIDLAYNSKRADDRKNWLETITSDTILIRTKGQSILANDFINSDVVLFSYDACVRSIPSLIDGLKPSQRKILFTTLTRSNPYEKLKVFQLGGDVAYKTQYHHGDLSMNQTIINMAQDYPTSGNNIPLLTSYGEFGSRNENGEDAGAPRYISCSLSKITKYIFPSEDYKILSYKIEDNKQVEPEYYIPIIPFVLINGAKGIGTGWSTEIPSYNPVDIINYVKFKINNKINQNVDKSYIPNIRSWYKGFTGEINPVYSVKNTENKESLIGWEYNGIIKKINNNSFHISELPIGYSINKLQNRLQVLSNLYKISQLENNKKKEEELQRIINFGKDNKVLFKPLNYLIKSYSQSNKSDIDFIVEFDAYNMDENEAFKAFQLSKTIKLSNMVLFDKNNKLKKFDTIEDIIDEWFDIRLNAYNKRKELILKELNHVLLIYSNKYRFIKEIIDDTLIIYKKDSKEINKELEKRNYTKIDSSYNYLLNMKISSFTNEKYEELKNEYDDLQIHIKEYENKSIETIWIEELDKLLNQL